MADSLSIYLRSLRIVAPQEEPDASLVHPLTLGKRKSPANQPPEALTKRVVKTLDIARLPVSFAARRMLLVGNHRKIRLPEVRETVLAAILWRDATPQATTGLYRPFPPLRSRRLGAYGGRSQATTRCHCPCHGRKTTSRLTLTRPQAQQGAEIDAGAGSDLLFFIQSASVWRLIPRTRATPRIEARS